MLIVFAIMLRTVLVMAYHTYVGFVAEAAAVVFC
jgi:hypothetical protein